tara:strand:+ start:91 stop:225 length:135 start_codon:yes stop_codon:yes gene_type:complete
VIREDDFFCKLTSFMKKYFNIFSPVFKLEMGLFQLLQISFEKEY